MQILNYYKNRVPLIKILWDKYLDFVLSFDDTPTIPLNGKLTEKCLISYIDLENEECIEEDHVHSMDKYSYDECVNDGAELLDFGFTGIDNGRISYDKSQITNKEFFDIFTGTTLEVESGDCRTHLYPVTGNTGVYSYDYEKNDGFYSLKGGFLQGFFKLFGFDYQVLPYFIENDWHFEFVLRPMDYEEKNNTLNSTHPDNKGIFFYMGTRAENKFGQFYNTALSEYESRKQSDAYYKRCSGFIDGVEYFAYEDPDIANKEDAENDIYTEYESEFFNKQYETYLSLIYPKEEDIDVDKEYDDFLNNLYNDNTGETKEVEAKTDEDTTSPIEDSTNKKEDKKAINKKSFLMWEYFFNKYPDDDIYCKCATPIKKKEEEKKEEEEIIEDCLIWDESAPAKDCDSGYYNDDDSIDYYEQDVSLSGITVETSEGRLQNDTGYFEIETDNKFLIFNRTKTGFTVNTYEPDSTVLLTGFTKNSTTNLFLSMNRTKTGYTVNTIDNLYSDTGEEYDLMKNVRGNSFALKINDDGSIGYKFLVKDCDSDTGWSIKEESSLPNIVKKGEWNVINVRLSIVNGSLNRCGTSDGNRKMKLMIYVNGYLKFISKELPELTFKELDDTYEKQEGVPYNISLGGGTQGLCDSVWLDYYMAFDKILPIEKNFAGTFNGDIKSFKFYDCALQYNEIKNNYLYETNK